jgi:hypothetical protein
MGAGLRSRAQTFSVPYSSSWRRSFGGVILARHRLRPTNFGRSSISLGT